MPRGVARSRVAINPWCDTSTGWIPDECERSRVVHDSQGRCADCRHDAQRCRRAVGGQLLRRHIGHRRPRPARLPVSGSPTITVNLVEPGTLHGDRVNQVDMRFAKVLRFGRTRTTVGFDVYNLANSAPVLTYNQTFIVPTRDPDVAVAAADQRAAPAVSRSSACSSTSSMKRAVSEVRWFGDHAIVQPGASPTQLVPATGLWNPGLEPGPFQPNRVGRSVGPEPSC